MTFPPIKSTMESLGFSTKIKSSRKSQKRNYFYGSQSSWIVAQESTGSS
jgi:hypothetical protein